MIAAGKNQMDILVVENSLSDLRLLTDLLVLEGYQVRSAQTSLSALSAIDNHHPHLILLNINMPDLNGFQLGQQLKANSKTAHIPIMLITDDGETNKVVRGFDMGAVDYITKPFHTKEIIARVRPHIMLAQLEAKLEQQDLQIQQSLQQKMVLEKQLLDREQMASLGRSVASITHELSTPLGLCVTATSYLHDKASSFKNVLKQKALTVGDGREFIDTVEETLGIVMANLGRSTEMMGNFKTVAVDVSSEKIRTFALIDYLHRVINSLSPALEKTPHKVKISGVDAVITTYPGALAQVITNLVMNSIIHAFDDDNVGHITLDIHTKEDHVILQFADDGKGISAEGLGKLFDAYYTSQATNGGSGLGTFIIKELITQKLQGQVNCSSELGVGTVFNICLPIERVLP